MTDRLLKLLDPDDLNRSQRIGWVAGQLIGALVGATALVVALTYLNLT